MAVVLLSVVCLFLLSVLLYSWIQNNYSGRMRYLRALPTGLPTLPLLGHLHHFIFGKDDLQTGFISVLRRMSALQLRLFCFWFGETPMVFINDPEYVQIVLNKSNSTSDKGQLYRLLKFCMGGGLATAEVSTWKVTRRHLSSLFHPQQLEHLVPVINKTSQQLVQQISNEIGVKPIDADDYLLDFAIKNALRMIFGPKLEIDLDPSSANKIKTAITLCVAKFGENYS